VNSELGALLTTELRLPVEQLSELIQYIGRRWNYQCPSFYLLKANGYVDFDNQQGLVIRKPAFELVQEIEPSTIFISYRRKDSSAFALLILKYLKENGLDAFLDLALVPGEDWHAGLKERIQGYDFLILILSKETLSSEFVL
jgi:TIR domain-containing protein